MTPNRHPWCDDTPALSGLALPSRASLAVLPPQTLPKGTTLFRPGDIATGFVVVLSGRIEVHLTGPSGREILLYAVEPGQSCVQTTLGLMADETYSGEALAATDASAVIIPRALFSRLINDDPAFRSFVLMALGRRMCRTSRAYWNAWPLPASKAALLQPCSKWPKTRRFTPPKPNWPLALALPAKW